MIERLYWMLPVLLTVNAVALAAWLMPRDWRVVLRTSRAVRESQPVAAEQAERRDELGGLETWIDEVERDESETGGENFWREWATGGNVPPAADSDRVAS